MVQTMMLSGAKEFSGIDAFIDLGVKIQSLHQALRPKEALRREFLKIPLSFPF
jgi:hypothetical protein